ncbi:hypothetical protein N9575_01650 [Flavobacteriaceae bacterium]|nr:hypothetical protein [Flavobacteriaceae bacterium]MDA9984754.1 hypothetical protein [Flavobacteriaceae bacterium]MDB4118228.1 hypothetical protein [Flavobacteriaceae bacterium]
MTGTMDELKSLKNKWANQKFDKQYSAEELNGLIQKKSKSSIKYIFYLSVTEFFLYISIPFIVPNYYESFDYYKSLNLYEFSIATSVIGYILLLYFMLRFFRNYKRISVTDSVKGHLSTILNTRRAVNQYIYFSLGILLVFLCVVMYSALLFDENLITLQEKKDSIVMIIFIIGLVISLIIGVFGLLYYFLYGRLLNPLKKNEKELMNINH